jgi:hypothetical protein
MLNSITSEDTVKIKIESKETKPALRALNVNCKTQSACPRKELQRGHY